MKNGSTAPEYQETAGRRFPQRAGMWLRVSVIVLNYDGWPFLRECITALASLDYPKDRSTRRRRQRLADGSVESVRRENSLGEGRSLEPEPRLRRGQQRGAARFRSALRRPAETTTLPWSRLLKPLSGPPNPTPGSELRLQDFVSSTTFFRSPWRSRALSSRHSRSAARTSAGSACG